LLTTALCCLLFSAPKFFGQLLQVNVALRNRTVALLLRNQLLSDYEVAMDRRNMNAKAFCNFIWLKAFKE
jgi:hypothetical protein